MARAYVGIETCAMARSPIYSAGIAVAAGREQQRREGEPGPEFEHSEPHHVGAHPARAGGRLGDRDRAACDLAFLLFLAAAISDAVDGFLAKRFGMKTELGAYLDPLADKVLIVSIYVTLGITGVIPLWIVILVVSRDFMIVGAIILSWLVDRPVAIQPHIVSKLNTAAQIVFAGLVLASRGFDFDAEPVLTLVMALVAVLTLLSVGLYLAEWVRHMNSAEAGD